MLKKIIFFFFCIITKLNAIDIDLYFQKAIKLNLAEHPTWLKLLHYNQESRRSEILDKDFFISEEGSINPNKELESTLLSFLLPAENDARCRFPARFLWLDKQLSFPEELKGFPNCEKLKN